MEGPERGNAGSESFPFRNEGDDEVGAGLLAWQPCVFPKDEVHGTRTVFSLDDLFDLFLGVNA